MSVWLKDGCININGVDYTYGKTIPVDKLSKDRLKELTDKGHIGDMPESVVPVKSDELAFQNKKLLKENTDLIKKNKSLSDEIQRLTVERDELKSSKKGKHK